MSASGALVPPISWAQRPEYVLMTIALQDTTNVKIELKEDGKVLHFACDAPEEKHYEYTLHFYAPIAPEESQHVVRPRQIELKLKKKFRKSIEEAEDDEVEWPRLTAEKTKHANITIDWAKWKDADDDDGAAGGADDLGDFGLGGGGVGGDAMDGQYAEMMNQLMQAQGQKDAEEHAGLAPGSIPAFGSAAGQEAMEDAGENEEDDMPPLEEDKD